MDKINNEENVASEISYNIKQRREFIAIIYRYYVLGRSVPAIIVDIKEDSQVILKDEQKELLISWFDRVDEMQNFCEQYLRNWKWDRLPNIHKACLFYGYFEIVDLKHPKGIVINEMLKLAELYLPDDKRSYMNAILDKIEIEEETE